MTIQWTRESADAHLRTYATGPDDYLTEVLDRLVETGECIWHAAHVVAVERVLDGRTPTDTCTLCGGRNRAGEGNHHLCVARAARGNPTPRLDIEDGMICGCADCRGYETIR